LNICFLYRVEGGTFGRQIDLIRATPAALPLGFNNNHQGIIASSRL
jgi:hypothetical protein